RIVPPHEFFARRDLAATHARQQRFVRRRCHRRRISVVDRLPDDDRRRLLLDRCGGGGIDHVAHTSPTVSRATPRAKPVVVSITCGRHNYCHRYGASRVPRQIAIVLSNLPLQQGDAWALPTCFRRRPAPVAIASRFLPLLSQVYNRHKGG